MSGCFVLMLQIYGLSPTRYGLMYVHEKIPPIFFRWDMRKKVLTL